jgi:lysyl endopeptidase
MKKPSTACLLSLGFLIAWTPSRALAKPRLTRSHPDKLLPLERVVRMSFPRLNNQALAARKVKPRNQFAEATPVVFLPRFDGTREIATVDGVDYAVYRVRLYSPGALSLNLGFSRYHMPVGGSLHIYSANGDKEIRAFTDEDNEEHGQLWTPLLETDEVVVEADVPLDSVDALELELSRVNHAFKRAEADEAPYSFEKAGTPDTHVSQSCNIDVVCPEGNPWRKQTNSVAVLTYDGTKACSGAAINSVPANNRPFFLTANHCQVTTALAPTVVAYWNFQNSVCRPANSTQSGEPGNGTFNDFNSGAYLRAAYDVSDFRLLEFDDPIGFSSHVFLAGWDRGSATPSSAVGIHHPMGAEKRISLEKNAPTITDMMDGTPITNGSFWCVNWDQGITEHVSSGSPLFNSKGLIVGQLFGGWSTCGGSDLRDWYGRLSVSWNGGGTTSTRLKSWLDPANTGVTTLQGRDILRPIIAPIIAILLR